MAKSREIERWVTINGNKVPIYKDGGMGGFMTGKENPHKETLKQADKIARAMAKNKMSEEDMQELIDEHDGDVDKALRSLEEANKTVARETARKKEEDIHYDTRLNDIRERMRKGEITAEQAKDEAFDYEKSQRGNKRWNDQDRNNMESKVRDIFDEADERSRRLEKTERVLKETEENAARVHEEAKNISDDVMDPTKWGKPGQKGNKNREYFEQAKKEGRIDKDAEYEDFIDYSPITETKAKKAVEKGKQAEIANENDAYDKAHKEGKYEKAHTINDRLAEDAEKFKKDPNVAAREGWGNGYYQEVKEYMNSQKKESYGGSFEAELEEYSDPEYKNVTKGVKTERQAADTRNMPTRSQEQIGKYKPLSKDEEAVVNQYMKDNPWAIKLANDQLSHGEDYHKIRRQMYDAATLSKKNEATRQEVKKSIKVGNKEVGVTKAKSVRDIVGNDKNSEWKLSKAYDRTSLKNIALDAGISSKRVNSMTTAELREMLLSMWKKG